MILAIRAGAPSDAYVRYASERGTNPARKITAQKKWPLARAAKFREETPRKGGGITITDRNTALQQYEETRPCPQAQNYNHSRQNAAEMLEKTVTFAHFITGLLPLAAYVQRNMRQQA